MKDEIPEDKLGEENKKRKIEKIKGIDKMVNRENLICKKDNTYIYIYMNFRRKTKPRKSEKQQEEKTLLKAHIHFLNVKK